MVWSVNAVDTPLSVSDVSRSERGDGIISCSPVEPDPCVTINVLDVLLQATGPIVELFRPSSQVSICFGATGHAPGLSLIKTPEEPTLLDVAMLRQ